MSYTISCSSFVQVGLAFESPPFHKGAFAVAKFCAKYTVWFYSWNEVEGDKGEKGGTC